jgi:hypothetical protein
MISATLRSLIALALAALLAAPAIGAPKAPSGSAAKAEACALGARVMADQARRGAMVFDGLSAFPPDHFQAAARAEQWHLSEAHQAFLAKRTAENLFASCPELAGRLPKGTRMATPEDLASVREIVSRNRVYVGQILTPVIAPDRRTALVFESISCSGLCGSGSIYPYHHVDGAWVRGKAILLVFS